MSARTWRDRPKANVARSGLCRDVEVGAVVAVIHSLGMNYRLMDERRTANLLGAMALAISDTISSAGRDAIRGDARAAAALVHLLHHPSCRQDQLRGALELSQPGTVHLVKQMIEAAVPDGLTDGPALVLIQAG